MHCKLSAWNKASRLTKCSGLCGYQIQHSSFLKTKTVELPLNTWVLLFILQAQFLLAIRQQSGSYLSLQFTHNLHILFSFPCSSFRAPRWKASICWQMSLTPNCLFACNFHKIPHSLLPCHLLPTLSSFNYWFQFWGTQLA